MRARIRVSLPLLVVCLALLGMLTGASTASAAFGDRALREGMEGRDVTTLQRKLNKLDFETGVDGFYGAGTKQSMKKWERANGRTVNGACSRREASRIKRQVKRQRTAGPDAGADEPSAPDPEPESGPALPEHAYASRRMRKGDRGTDVAKLQRFLRKLGLTTRVDGYFGEATLTNVKKWEAWRYLKADGLVNKNQAKKIRSLANSGAAYQARKNVFPVRGPHSYGGSGSRFGAPRGGRSHQGQDVAAAHGTPLVAVHSGRVAYRQYQAGGAGHYLVIHGRDGSDSVYMHLPRPGIVAPGDYVRAGERIGRVGNTGSSTGPHLHFELWTPNWYAGGGPYDPLEKLQRWDSNTP